MTSETLDGFDGWASLRTRAWVVAEIGNNHCGRLDLALKLVDAAADCGCDAVKFQTRHNSSLFTTAFGNSAYTGRNSYGDTYLEHRHCLELGFDAMRVICSRAHKRGLVCFSTPFDIPSVHFLEELNVPMYKVASYDLRNFPLLERLRETRKPVILSTGGAELGDIRAALTVIDAPQRTAILQCTSQYPLQWADVNLAVIVRYVNEFGAKLGPRIGFSDHTNGISLVTAAYAMGARIFEKHFTLDRTLPGTDHALSLEPVGMRKYVRDLRRIEQAMGDGDKRALPCEQSAHTKLGKSLYTDGPHRAGDVLRLKVCSPGGHTPPNCFEYYSKRRATRDLPDEHPIEHTDAMP